MTKQIDDQFLNAMGLDGIKGEAKDRALANILFTLNINIGKRVADMMTKEQYDDFERLSRPGADPEKLSLWLGQAIPNYGEMAEEETQKLRDETLSQVDRLIAKVKDQSKKE